MGFLTHLQELEERMLVLAIDFDLPEEGEVRGVAIARAHVLHAIQDFLPTGTRFLLEVQTGRAI